MVLIGNVTSIILLIFGLKAAHAGKLEDRIKNICTDTKHFLEKNPDERLKWAYDNHCGTSIQLTGLVSAFYHLSLDAEQSKQIEKAKFLTAKLREAAVLSKIFPDHHAPDPKWKVGESIYELSGFAYSKNKNELWMLGDSGTGPYVAKLVGSTGKAFRYKVEGAKNIDWEAIVFDELGNLWILDVGDNRRKRKDVSLYKVSIMENDVLSAQKFDVHFPKGAMDCEGAIVYKNHLLLFEKTYFLSPKVVIIDLSDPTRVKFTRNLPKMGLITDSTLTSDGRLYLLTYLGVDEVIHWRSLIEQNKEKPLLRSMISLYWGQIEAISSPSPKTLWIGREDGHIFETQIPKELSKKL